jgi:hypothetical protein
VPGSRARHALRAGSPDSRPAFALDNLETIDKCEEVCVHAAVDISMLQSAYHNVKHFANAQAPHCFEHKVLQVLPPLLHLLMVLQQICHTIQSFWDISRHQQWCAGGKYCHSGF